MGLLKNLNPTKQLEEQMKITKEGYEISKEANRIIQGNNQKLTELTTAMLENTELMKALIGQLQEPLQLIPAEPTREDRHQTQLQEPTTTEPTEEPAPQ